MGNTTKIDWCDSTWNPVTGCLHGCDYCLHRVIANRCKGYSEDYYKDSLCFQLIANDGELIVEIEDPMMRRGRLGKPVAAPYPFGFRPTLHRYRLDELQSWEQPRNIFVCSMGDLFGDWVPDAWIDDVLRATQKALQHRYLFLTKNPKRDDDWIHRFEMGSVNGMNELSNCWFGASASNNAEFERANCSDASWISIEPIREKIGTDENQFMEFQPYSFAERRRWQWVVIGAETGNSKNKVIPQKEWIQEIAYVCKRYETPVFMKESLREMMGDDFRQEFPWEG